MAKRTESDPSGDVQSQMDEEQEQGFRGTKVDETPNENYTVSGVTSGAETPETKTPGEEGSTKSSPDAGGTTT